MSGLGKLARALLNGPSAPATPPPGGGLSSLAARLRTGAAPAANEAPAPLAETTTAVPQANQNGAAARTVASSHGAAAAPPRPALLTDLASRLAAPAPQAPSPRISDIAARLTTTPREEFVRLPLAGGYMAWPDVGTRVRWTEETRERHGKVYRHGTVELSGRVTRVDTTRPNDIDVWAAPDGGQERRVGIAGIRVPATDVPRFVERAKARHAADLERNLREVRERDRARETTQDLFDEGAAETAYIVSFLREQAQEQPQTKTGIKIGSLLRACATTIERRTPRENEAAHDASRAAVDHLRSVAAKTSGKPGEALYVAAKAIESGRHLMKLTPAASSTVTSSSGERIDAGSPITADDAIEDDGDQARAGATPTKPIVPSTRPKPSGPPMHWSPVERPLTARLTHDERDAARRRAPVTVEDHLVRAWDALAAVHRGEERDANLAYAQRSLSAAAAGVPQIPVHSQREKAEDEVGALRSALSAVQGIDIDTPPSLEEPATPSGTPITDDEEVARYYALQPEPVAPSRLVYIYAPSNSQHQQNIEAVAALREAVGADRLPLLRARAAVRAGHYTARSAAEALRIRDALRRADVLAELAEDEELKQRGMSSEAGTARDALPASSKPIVPAAAPAAGIPAPTKPIVPAAASANPAPTKPITPAGAVPAPTKPVVPARAEPAPTRTIAPVSAKPSSAKNGNQHAPSAPRWYEIVRFTIPEEVFENLPTDALRALRRGSKSLGVEWMPPDAAHHAYHTAPTPARSYPVVVQALAKVPSWSTDDATADYVFGATKASADYDGFGTLQLTQLPNGHRIVAVRREHHNWQVQRYLSSGIAGFKPMDLAEIEKLPPPVEATADEGNRDEPPATSPRDIATVARQTGRLVHVHVGDARVSATPDPEVAARLHEVLRDEAVARKVHDAFARAAQPGWTHDVAKTQRVLDALRAAIGGHEALARRLLELLKGAWEIVVPERERDAGGADAVSADGRLMPTHTTPTPTASVSKRPTESAATKPAAGQPPPADASADDESAEEAQSSRSWARAAALHDAEVMIRQFGPGLKARVGDVLVQTTPDWMPPKAPRASTDAEWKGESARIRKRLRAPGGMVSPAEEWTPEEERSRIVQFLRGAATKGAPKMPEETIAWMEEVASTIEDGPEFPTAQEVRQWAVAQLAALTKMKPPSGMVFEVFRKAVEIGNHHNSDVIEALAETPETEADDGEVPEPSIVERVSPVEHRTAAARRDANIKAMELAAELEAHPRRLTEEDRRTLLEYSDWGGVGIGKWADRFPPGFPVPEKRQLIHAYFTPPAVCAEIARIVKPLLPDLMSTDGKVHALEPSAGIGRFPLALSGPGFEALAWHCVEFSTVSYKMLRLLRPDIDLFHGPFERWIAERAEDFAGRLKLVISNPPYGQRNQALTEDPDRSYRYDRADSYFLRRGLDLLGAGGLGIYIIPSGFLTGTTEDARKLREEVLLRHHLSAAFRLPNEVFSLANVVTDILIFRARGAILSEVDDGDRFILEGGYYEEFPSHILGQIVQHEPGKRGWHSTGEGYTVVGEFTAIPPFEERPICATCQHLPVPGPVEPPPTPAAAEASKAGQIIDRDDRMAAAVGLGRRVEAFLASVANPDHEPIGWDELHHDLTEWAETHGAPGKDKDVIALAKAERGPLGRGEPGGAGWLLKAFLGVSATLIPPLAERPRWAPRFIGDANDPLQVGDYLYRTRKKLRIDDLPGKDPSALFAAGWCEDSPAPAWTERLDVRGELLPPDEYLFGELWPKFDRADARGRLGDVQGAAQARRLLELIQPATFDEIEISPQDGFIPLDLLSTWLATLNHGEAVHLVRDKGLVHLADVAYEDHGRGLLDLSQEALLCLGWINHDYVVFQPYAGKDENIDEIRLGYAKDWTERFRAFCEADPERQRAIERSYQRARQGYRAHGYGSEPLKLLRWNPAIVLNPHQIAGARRLDANRGGGLAFDVGVGKTFTVLAALALARQQGRARRPVIVVPQPIALQWVDNIGKALPDFRVVVIGLNKKTLSRGLRKGLETSETDSPEERSRKWARFQGGEFDVAIVTYESLPRSKMDQESMLRFIEGVTAIEREVELKRRNAKMQQKQSEESYREKKESLEAKLARAKEDVENRFGVRKQKAQEKQRKLEAKLKELEEKHAKRRLTERQEAILEEGVGAWLAEMLELPEGWKHDPDIVWQKLGITWIAFDEAHNGKNLHMPSSREGGSVPKFMGNEGEGSHRAWHWYFRCCDVQSRGGEVVLATATPASNSPLEFYNLVKLMDDKAWTRIGIHDPEAFIDRFCLLEPEEVVSVDMQTQTRMACVGFKNLDELRSVIMKLWEFKTAKQAKLKLPTPKIEREFVDMDAAQEKKYQQYVEEIEYALANPKEGSHKILGLLQRMASVAQHAQLDEKFEWSDAHLVASPHSPKYDALAKRVLALRGCGHIVFSDYVPAHAWIRDVLIEAGIPAQRIGILNAVVAPTAADRQRTAREFNGSETVAPKYDVLIANMIGEEGVDLQRRACAIHHMDIGWTPKKFDQRNGRGYRQGNTLANIEIVYYIANRSQDGSRLDMVRGKQNWISSLLEGEGKEVNNPAAQSTLTRKELLVLISRDPEKTRARLEAAEAEREEERKKKVASAASGTLRAVANRFDRARTETNPTVAAEHLSVARQKLAGLAKVDPAIWPWMAWAQEAERHPMLVPKEGGPVYEGLRVAMPRLLDRSMIDYAEFGRIDGSAIGTRVAGTANWDETSLDKVVQLRLAPEMRIAEGGAAMWPADDQAGVDRAITEKWLPRLRSGAGTNDAWTELGWTRAPDHFVERQWAQWGAEIVRAMESTGGWATNLRVPVVTRERLVFGLRPPHGEVIPPTLAGWRRFLELAPTSGEKFSVLEDVGRWWFGRTIPRNLLSAAREDAPASSGASAAPHSKANVPHAA